MSLKKILGILAIVLLAYFIIARPDSASASATSITESLTGAADSVLLFFSEITT